MDNMEIIQALFPQKPWKLRVGLEANGRLRP